MTRKTFFLAVNTGYSVLGTPDPRSFSFYADRSGNGLYCAIVGNVVLPGADASNNSCTFISDAPAWSQLASSIRARGAKPGIQLASAVDGYVGMTRFIARFKDDSLRNYASVAAEFTSDDVRRAFDNLDRGTDLAVKAGFSHVQLHAAHGYLFNLLLDPLLSPVAEVAKRRLDRWLRDLKTSSIESSVRLSVRTGHVEFDTRHHTSNSELAANIDSDYIDISSGFYNIDKRLIYPYKAAHLKQRYLDTTAIADQNPAKQFILSGKALSVSAELPANIHIGLCRDLIANPNFLKQPQKGCENRMQCHYYSRGEESLTCGAWM